MMYIYPIDSSRTLMKFILIMIGKIVIGVLVEIGALLAFHEPLNIMGINGN